MPNERIAVNGAVAGIAALGVLSAAIPVVGTVLLVVVILGVAGALGVGIRLWHTTRFPHLPPNIHRAATPVEHTRKEVA
jgi:hypothetical protein